MPTRTWRELRRCRDAAEAASVASALAGAGIDARVPEPHILGLQATCRRRPDDIRILVPDDEFAAAVACLAAAPPSIDRDVNADDDRASERQRMVDTQLRARGITDPDVLAAMAAVPRHHFVPADLHASAYNDTPLPIGYGQTISQPYIVAFMTQALGVRKDHAVLEIGTGSGYQAAVLGRLAGRVDTIEVIDELAASARATLARHGTGEIVVHPANGYQGWPPGAPYDRIIVTAAADAVPPALVDQLSLGGLIAVPVGTEDQELQVLRKTPDGLDLVSTLPVRFVPMTGKPGAR